MSLLHVGLQGFHLPLPPLQPMVHVVFIDQGELRTARAAPALNGKQVRHLAKPALPPQR